MSAQFQHKQRQQQQQQQKNINSMKRSLTLDLNQARKNLNVSSMLSSPDMNMLKVGTPELEKIILDNAMSTSTPTPNANPNTLLFPRTVTEEQEDFTAGFVDALNHLHNSSSQASDSSNLVYTELEQSNLGFLPMIKEEPQTVPSMSSSPPVSPVDMVYQERIKLERKRQRNCLAASKCRSKKLERISNLEDKVKHLKGENIELSTMINQLREHVNLLKVEVMQHVNNSCQIML